MNNPKKFEKYYLNLIENQPYMVCRWLPDTTLIYINKAYAKFYGYKKEELIRKKWITFVPKNSRKKIIEFYNCLVNNPKKVAYEYKVIRADGSERWIQWYDIPIVDKNKRLIEFQSFGRDVTDRKIAVESLRLSEEKCRKIFNLSPIPIIITELKTGAFYDVNKAFLKMFEYKKSEIINNSTLNIIWKSREKRKYFLNQLRKKGHVYNMEVSAQTKTGKPIEHLIFSELINIEGKPFILTAAIDISESQKQKEEILKYQKQLKQLAAAVSTAERKERKRLAGEIHDNISHNLAIIKMKLALLNTLNLDSETRKILDEISELNEEAIKQTRNLIFDLSPPILYELNFVSSIEWLIGKFMKKYGLKIMASLDRKSISLNNETKYILFQTLRELLRNIVKHAKVKKANISLEVNKNMLKLTVRDSGSGFDTKDIFSKIDVQKRFGLFNIREQIESIGGKFEIKSAIGKGTTAIITVNLIDTKLH